MRYRGSMCVALAASGLLAAGAHAKSEFSVRGAGFGHGVGMSQYGAYGFALEGFSYEKILRHYYTDTKLGRAGGKTVRVLLQPSVSRSSVSGARSVNGRRLKPRRTYYVRHGSGSDTATLTNTRGKRLKTAPVLVVRGAGQVLDLGGVGSYRGRLEYRAAGTLAVQAVNALGMENYVRGVIARESPSSWPAEALKAQAVAARTYAMTTSKAGDGFDQYPDTRSQVYGGIAAETATTDAATRATRNEVVTYDGEPVTTYFFSTSGGRTEDVENTSLGDEPLPWLKSVKDPYDDLSPKHRWRMKSSMGAIDTDLGGLVKGNFRGIDVVSRGTSPRVVEADVVGTRGRTRVTGATLRAELGLFDTWAYFTSIRTSKSRTGRVSRSPRFGTTPEARAAALATHRLEGRVIPARRNGDVLIQHRSRGKWRRVGVASTDRRGFFAFLAEDARRYRVRYRGTFGPVVTVQP